MNQITRPIEVITQEINFYKVQAGAAGAGAAVSAQSEVIEAATAK